MTSKDEKKILDIPNRIAVLDEKNANIIIWDGKRPIRSGKSYLLSLKYKNGVFFTLSAKGGVYNLAPTLQKQYGVVLKYENVGWDKIWDKKSYAEVSEVYPIPDSILLNRKPIDIIFYSKGVLIMDNYGILRFDGSSIRMKYIFRFPHGALPINMFIIGPEGELSEEHVVVSMEENRNTIYITNISTEIFRSGNTNKTAIKHPEKETLIGIGPNSIDEFDYSWNKLNHLFHTDILKCLDIGIAHNEDYSLLLIQDEEYFYIYNLDTSVPTNKYVWKMKDKVLPQINTISGHYLAVGDRNRIVLYDLDKGEAFQYSHNSEFTLCLGVLRNGDIIISAESGLIVVYDPDKRKEIFRMENASGAFYIFPTDPKEIVEVKKTLYSFLKGKVSKDLSDLVAKYI